MSNTKKTATAQPILKSRTITENSVKYTIINSRSSHNIRRSIYVRLKQKTPESDLRSIAYDLKNKADKQYERTFISYYLPGVATKDMAWAVADFNPELEISILGLTIEQEVNLSKESKNLSREIIGAWLNEYVICCKITIYKHKGKLYMERKFVDGSLGSEEIVKKNSSLSGKCFEDKKGSAHGDYYRINNQGNLETRDNEGLISTSKKTEN